MNNPNADALLYFLKCSYAPSAWVGHLDFAMYLVRTFEPKIIVDLGVDYGHSTFALAGEGIGTVYGVDCFEGDIHTGLKNTYTTVTENYSKLLEQRLLPNDNIVLIKGNFDDVFHTFDKSIDLLHIDGLHTYEAVKNNFDKWSTLINTDGIIIMHNITALPETAGKFFSEINLPKTMVSHSAGLGIISRNQSIIDRINDEWISKLV